MNKKMLLLKELEDLRFEMLDKQNRLDDLLHKAINYNKDRELWLKLDSLIESYQRKKNEISQM